MWFILWSVAILPQQRELQLILQRQRECCQIIKRSMLQFARQNQKYFIELRGITTVRVQRMDRVNHEAVSKYFNSAFLHKLTESCSTSFSGLLDKWKGVTKSRKFKSNDDVHFKRYFQTAKNWFDHSKVDLLSDLYWMPLFTAIDRVWFCFSHSASDRIVIQSVI